MTQGAESLLGEDVLYDVEDAGELAERSINSGWRYIIDKRVIHTRQIFR